VITLGKVRTETVKRVSIELVKKYPYSFNKEFQENKEFLDKIGLEVTKKFRNKIAGYITRLISSESELVSIDEEEYEDLYSEASDPNSEETQESLQEGGTEGPINDEVEK
jgi:small subunit ribosomal protein S17e